MLAFHLEGLMPEENTLAPAPPAPSPAPPEPATFSREFVSELRHENGKWRQKSQEEAAKAAAAAEAATQATKEAEAKIAAAQTAANDRILRSELKAEAVKAGMVDLDGLKLADLSKVKLNAETGDVEGATELMAELKKAKPYLFGAAGSTSNPSAQPPKPGEQKRKAATEMTKEEYAAARADIRRGIVPKASA